jgi:pimeloyl-ACP methyl ester carboxylesterase
MAAEATAVYVDRDAFTAHAATVGEDTRWPLPGTLLVPCRPRQCPAVVLVHGSGPQDRDETIGAVKPFRDIAEGLSSRGVVTLRYDKRTKAHALTPAEVPTATEETVEDAALAVGLVRHHRAVDPTAVFVLGHSQGGTLAGRIAAAAEEPLAGLILAAAAARPLHELAWEQLRYLAEQDWLGAGSARAMLERATVRGGPPQGILELLGAPPSWITDMQRSDPGVEVAASNLPTLVMQGGRDYQVGRADFDLWRDALAAKGGRFRWFGDLNHAFVAGKGPSTPLDYQPSGQVVAAEVVEAIVSFVYDVIGRAVRG